MNSTRNKATFEKCVLTLTLVMSGFMLITADASASPFVKTVQNPDILKAIGLALIFTYLGVKLFPATDRSL